MYNTPEIKSQIKTWIEALESGKYKPARGFLNPSPNHYCCLGVACKVFVPEYEKTDNELLLGFVPRCCYGAPEWLVAINDDFKSKTGQYLNTLNDFHHFTHEAIAELLRLVYLEEMSVDLRELQISY